MLWKRTERESPASESRVQKQGLWSTNQDEPSSHNIIKYMHDSSEENSKSRNKRILVQDIPQEPQQQPPLNYNGRGTYDSNKTTHKMSQSNGMFPINGAEVIDLSDPVEEHQSQPQGEQPQGPAHPAGLGNSILGAKKTVPNAGAAPVARMIHNRSPIRFNIPNNGQQNAQHVPHQNITQVNPHRYDPKNTSSEGDSRKN